MALVVLQFSLQVLALFLNVPPVTVVEEKLFSYEKNRYETYLLVLGRENSRVVCVEYRLKKNSKHEVPEHYVAKKINFTG